ncbi:MAG: cobaltochelatase subunit CobN, partial [Chloroflexota bacterium]|nr:cobaltochelatase subunit CobN [Chloroflexota bacterium]
SKARVVMRSLLSGEHGGDVRTKLERYALPENGEFARTAQLLAERIIPNVRRATDEITHLLAGVRGRHVPPGPSGPPTRGMTNVLPTGRNFYALDVRAIPSRFAWAVGARLGEALLRTAKERGGAFPRAIAISVWGTANMRTQGDDIAEILWLLGVRPTWHLENGRVSGLEIIPLEELGRPRIDVTVRISGFFRDSFPGVVTLLDRAVSMVADLPEDPEHNYVRAAAMRAEREQRVAGMNAGDARRRARFRIFGNRPGSYGTGVLELISSGAWRTAGDLAGAYLESGGFAYGEDRYGEPAPAEFRARLAASSIAVQNQDNREHDIFDSDDYMQYHGGMIATVRALTGKNPRQFFGDSANPTRPQVRDLDDEARRVFRSRVVNPKWIESMKRHGYKGAFELAATVDYLFGYDATAQVVDDWMYERLTQAYVQDPAMRQFFAEKNPWALRDVAERLIEAIDRGLWERPSPEQRQALEEAYLDMDTTLEGRHE